MIQPVHDNLLVKVDMKEVKTKTDSGILLSAATKGPEKQNMGEVISVGEGRLLNNGTVVPSSVKVGDHIMFNAFAGTEIMEDDTLYLLLKENDILAILK